MMRRSLKLIVGVGAVGALLLPLSAAATPAPPWHKQVSHVSEGALKGINFLNSCVGWSVGEPPDASGTFATPIVATSNGGKTWTHQNSGLFNTTLNRVKFVDRNHGWAVGEPREFNGNASSAGLPTILATSNGGRNWVQQTNNVSPPLDITAENDLEGLSFVSPRDGWLALSSFPSTGTVRGGILHTSNGGRTYQQQTIPDNTVGVADVNFADKLNGWAVTDDGSILHTTDGGANWGLQLATGNPGLEKITFFNANRGVTAGDDGAILSTVDGGTTWTPATINAPAGSFSGVTLTDISYPQINLVVISTDVSDPDPGVVLISNNNAGSSFTPQRVGVRESLNSVSYAPGTNHGWVSGGSALILSNNPNAGAGC